MSPQHASKTMSTLTRLRRVKPIIPNDDDDRSTILSTIHSKDYSFNQDTCEQQSDPYRPLAPDEADENQLVGFFQSLDFDVSFGDIPTTTVFSFDMENVTKYNEGRTTRNEALEEPSSKRRRLTSGDVSVSSYSSEDTFGYSSSPTDYERKRMVSRTVSTESCTLSE